MCGGDVVGVGWVVCVSERGVSGSGSGGRSGWAGGEGGRDEEGRDEGRERDWEGERYGASVQMKTCG